jgi:hypothetical protein
VRVKYCKNSAPVYLLGPEGPAHRLTDDGWHTQCGLPAGKARKTTYAAVHVFLDHAICLVCFGKEGQEWP